MGCGKNPGSLWHEEVDAQTFADWGLDYLKYDNCYIDDEYCQCNFNCPNVTNWRAAILRYSAMSNALNKTGRPIFFSMCNWGQENVAVWGPDVGNSMRTDLDMTDEWSILARNVASNNKAQAYSRPGAHMDLDFL